RARLEHRLRAARVEVTERDEVVQEAREVAVVVREAVDRGDRRQLRSERLVLLEQRADLLARRAIEQLLEARRAERRDRAARAPGLPLGVPVERRVDLLPVVAG